MSITVLITARIRPRVPRIFSLGSTLPGGGCSSAPDRGDDGRGWPMPQSLGRGLRGARARIEETLEGRKTALASRAESEPATTASTSLGRNPGHRRRRSIGSSADANQSTPPITSRFRVAEHRLVEWIHPVPKDDPGSRWRRPGLQRHTASRRVRPRLRHRRTLLDQVLRMQEW